MLLLWQNNPTQGGREGDTHTHTHNHIERARDRERERGRKGETKKNNRHAILKRCVPGK